MSITRPAVRPTWGQSNTTSADMVDPGDSFIATGWPLSTQPPSRQYFNFELNYLGNGVRYFSRRGISDWSAAETYIQGDVCIASNGIVYQALAGNTNAPPQSSPASWSGLNGYALTSTLSGYVTTAALNTALASYVTSASLATTLGNYATLTQLAASHDNAILVSLNNTNAALTNYVTSSALTSTLSNYVTAAGLNSALGNYVTIANIVKNYPTFTYLQGNYWTATTTSQQISAALSQYYSAAQVNNLLGSYVSNTTLASDFLGNSSTNGYQKFPNGIIMQWGQASVPGGSNNVSFPIPFPHTCLSVQLTPVSANQGTIVTGYASTFFSGNFGGGPFSWFAVGH
jgi:hypothetical protein